MPSEPAVARPVLAFDASGPWIAAGLGRSFRHEPLERGQAERLIPLLESLLAEAGLGWRDLGGLAVGVGPGNFTGVRIAVAAARGLGLGLGVPVWGLTAFALLRTPAAPGEAAPDPSQPELVVLAAAGGQVQGQAWQGDRPLSAPVLFDPGDPPALPGLARVRGAEAARIGAALGLPASPDRLDRGLPERLSAAAARARAAGPPCARPAPLHVRPPDALPPSEAPPRLIEG